MNSDGADDNDHKSKDVMHYLNTPVTDSDAV